MTVKYWESPFFVLELLNGYFIMSVAEFLPGQREVVVPKIKWRLLCSAAAGVAVLPGDLQREHTRPAEPHVGAAGAAGGRPRPTHRRRRPHRGHRQLYSRGMTALHLKLTE